MDSAEQTDPDVNFDENWLKTWPANTKFAHWWRAVKHEPTCALPMVDRVRAKFALLGEDPSEDDICRVVSKTNRYYGTRSADFHIFPINQKSGKPNPKGWVNKHPDRTAPRLGYYERKLLCNCSDEARVLRRVRTLRAKGILPEDADRFVDVTEDVVGLNMSERETAVKMLRALAKLKLLPMKDLHLLKLYFSPKMSFRTIATLPQYNVSHVIISRRIKMTLRKARLVLWADERLRELFVDDPTTLEGRSK